MGVAILSGMRSKDPNTQVGACIVSADNKILSMGYNGFPTGCSDDEFPWTREGAPLDNKYLYTTHSELNAILNYRGGSLEVKALRLAVSVQRVCEGLSYRRVSRRSSMTAINMQVQIPLWRPRGCWTLPECVIINTTEQTGKSHSVFNILI